MLTPLEEDCRKKKNVVTIQDEIGDESNVKMMENKFCMFLHNNPNLLDYFGTIEGEQYHWRLSHKVIFIVWYVLSRKQGLK